MFRVSTDLGPIDEYLKIAGATAKTLADPRTQRMASEAMALSAASQFNVLMDQRAAADPAMFHHVYEWHELGRAEGRLWSMMLGYTGDNVVLTYNWRASNVPVPVGPAASGIENDTRSEVHIFEWKAPLMEEGAEVSVTPYNDVLAFPGDGRMMFTRSTINTELSGPHVGAFQNAWIEFFSAVGARQVDQEFGVSFDEVIGREIGHRIINQIAPSNADGVTVRTKAKKNPAARVDNSIKNFLSTRLRSARFRMGR